MGKVALVYTLAGPKISRSDVEQLPPLPLYFAITYRNVHFESFEFS